MYFVNEMAPQKEITGKRPSNYSTWHRAKLPKWCYHTDGDWFEQRLVNGKLMTVAYIETIEVPPLFINNAQHKYDLWPSKKALMADIYNRMKIPCFIVRHTANCKTFCVSQATSTGYETEATIMKEAEYIAWILNLHIGTPKH